MDQQAALNLLLNLIAVNLSFANLSAPVKKTRSLLHTQNKVGFCLTYSWLDPANKLPEKSKLVKRTPNETVNIRLIKNRIIK
jgi:hypothetical protein